MVRWDFLAFEATDVRASRVCLRKATYLNCDFCIVYTFFNLLLYDVLLFNDIFVIWRIELLRLE